MTDLNAEALSLAKKLRFRAGEQPGIRAGGCYSPDLQLYVDAANEIERLAALPAVDGEFARGVEAAALVADEFYDKAPSTDSNFIATDIAKAIRALSTASVGMEKDNEDRSFAALIEPLKDAAAELRETSTQLQSEAWGRTDGGFSLLFRSNTLEGAITAIENILSALSKREARSSSQSSEKET